MERHERLQQMYDYALNKGLCVNKGNFANLIGMANTNLSKALQGKKGFISDGVLIRANAAMDNIFNLDWLLTGEGEMLKQDAQAPAEKKTAPENTLPDNWREHALPLIPIDAVAGFNGIDLPGVQLADCARYTIPEFIEAKAEYLIRVSGSSMYPKYSSGDILACRKIQEVTFLQWGKVYVIDSQQGAMVKRLFEIEGDADNILCKSDNANYPPFKLPKSEIRSLSIVVGAIRLE